MRVFLSTIGTRGDVQPILALALAIQERGHGATVCAAPNFGEGVRSHGVGFVPLGPDLRNLTWSPPPAGLSPEQRRQLAAEGTVRMQFAALREAVPGHDLVVGAGTLQLAARSVAEAVGARYVFAGYCPLVFPSAAQPPVRMDRHFPLDLGPDENRRLWRDEVESWDALFGPALDEGRAALGLPPVSGVLETLLGEEPWLAADPALAPAPADRSVVQTGAWRLGDASVLPAELERFLDAGDPPVYLGLGSNRAPEGTGRQMLEAARAVGRRAVLSRGWAELDADPSDDWIAVGDLPHDALFPRLALVVHHGGAGTTTTATAAGVPQVVLPHHYDQFYFASRVHSLGLGVAAPVERPVPGDVLSALMAEALRPEVVAAAAAFAPTVVRDGARRAAERLTP